jgi:zinc D-Ala-D-Ala carboxypeptidase
MDLSRFFTLAEMTRSETASRESIPNQPAEAEVQNLRALCAAVLDPLREALAMPIKVNSGYRSPALNTRIGGASKSQHVEGKAADIQAPGISVLELFKTIIRMGLPFDQVIYEAASRTSKWVHVSHDPTRDRRQIMVAQFGPTGRPIAYPVFARDAALALTEPATRAAQRDAELGYVEVADEPESDHSPDKPPRARKRQAKRRSSKKRSSRKPAAAPKKSPRKNKQATGKKQTKKAKKTPATRRTRATKKRKRMR